MTQLQAWLRVFASGDQPAFARFIAANYAKALLDETGADVRAGLAGRTWLDARAFEIVSVEKSTDTEVTVLARSTLTRLWFRISMTVEAEPPHRIAAYAAQRIQPPHPKPLSSEELVREVSAFVDRIAAADAFSGTILIAKDGKPIYQTARGYASRAYDAKINLDTKFNLASIGKNFTAIAILQLIEAGKLSFDDKVGKLLPDYPNAEVREKVTIRHLLTHTSGLGELYSPKYECLKGSLREVRDYLPLFQDDPHPLEFAPGDHWQYSNAGFILLGAILERVSGENFYEYIRRHVFAPARLSSTDYYEADAEVPNRATGYTHFLDLGENNYEFHIDVLRNTLLRTTVRGNPQGGAFSSAPDMLRYANALPTLVSPKTLADMTTAKVEARRVDAAVTYWGYGFELEEINGHHVYGHTGGDFGVSSVFRVYPDAGNYTVIVLSNTDRGGQIAIYKIHELILFGG
ncbi:MAG TPA: serine hydrolase domain-containing protein [Thermoanaerobaculia bacterium]